MQLQVLKSKLQELIVTGANVRYEGSLTLDPILMDAAGLYPYERVEVNGLYTDSRIVTYVIPGKMGSGQVELNGGAARFFNAGDHIHVNCFAITDELLLDGTLHNEPIVVITDDRNKIIA